MIKENNIIYNETHTRKESLCLSLICIKRSYYLEAQYNYNETYSGNFIDLSTQDNLRIQWLSTDTETWTHSIAKIYAYVQYRSSLYDIL